MRLLLLWPTVTLLATGCMPSVQLGAPLEIAPPACAATADGPARLFGTLDVGAPPSDGYELALPAHVWPVTLQPGVVEVYFDHDSRNGEVLTDARLAFTGEFPRVTRLDDAYADGVLRVPLVNREETAGLASDPMVGGLLETAEDVVRVFATLRVRAPLGTGFVDSDWLTYRIDVCDGCLVPPRCRDAERVEGACRPGQDDPVTCEQP